MRVECIAHPTATIETGYFFTQLRREYWEICEPSEKEFNSAATRACAAKLLFYFENWMNAKLSSKSQAEYVKKFSNLGGHPDDHNDELWVYGQSATALEEFLMEHKPKIIKQALNWLVENGYLYRRENPTTLSDRCYQYQINVALVQRKINEAIALSQQKIAESLDAAHSSPGTVTVREELSQFATNQHKKDLPYRSSKESLEELESKGISGADSTTRTFDRKNETPWGENPVDSHGEKKIDRTEPIKERKAVAAKSMASYAKASEVVKDEPGFSTTDEPSEVLPTGQENTLEDSGSAPLFYSEKINNRLWRFNNKTGLAQLPKGDCYKLARAATNKAIQLWLVDHLRNWEDEDWRIVLTPSARLYVFDPRQGLWFNSKELHTIAKLWGLVQFFENCALTYEDYNKFAIEAFERIAADVAQSRGKVTIPEKNLLRAFEIEHENVPWENPDDELNCM